MTEPMLPSVEDPDKDVWGKKTLDYLAWLKEQNAAIAPDNGGRAVGKGELVVNSADFSGTPAEKIQGAIDEVETSGGGDVLIPNEFDLEDQGITVAQGTHLVTAGFKRAKVKYGGSGFAFTFSGTTAQDSRRGGGADRLTVVLTNSGASGIDIVDARDLKLDVRVLGGNETTTRLGAYGIRMRSTDANIGTSWNEIDMYVEYCATGLRVDGSPSTPVWATRSHFNGHVQSCDTGIHLTDASTHDFSLHPQNCTAGWVLDGTQGSDTNDIYTVCEGCTEDFNIGSASQNNRIRGSFTIPSDPAKQGYNTAWFGTTFTQLPRYRTFEWDPGSGNFLDTPAGGVLGSRVFYTRKNTGALVKQMQMDGGSTSPRLRLSAPTQVDGDVGFYGTTPIAKQTGVAVTTEAIHAALVALGLISA